MVERGEGIKGGERKGFFSTRGGYICLFSQSSHDRFFSCVPSLFFFLNSGRKQTVVRCGWGAFEMLG